MCTVHDPYPVIAIAFLMFNRCGQDDGVLNQALHKTVIRRADRHPPAEPPPSNPPRSTSNPVGLSDPQTEWFYLLKMLEEQWPWIDLLSVNMLSTKAASQLGKAMLEHQYSPNRLSNGSAVQSVSLGHHGKPPLMSRRCPSTEDREHTDESPVQGAPKFVEHSIGDLDENSKDGPNHNHQVTRMSVLGLRRPTNASTR